jgi:drug/metabolite transporter (DMT)-like permease
MGTCVLHRLSAIFGGIGLAVQGAVAAGFALPVLLATRYLATAGTVGTLALAKGELRQVRPRRSHAGAFGLGLASIAQTGCYFAAITRVDVALVLALHFTFPALVLAIEAVIAHTVPTRRQAVSCLVALCGVALVALGGRTGGADPVGLALAGGSGLAYAGILVGWTRVLRRLPSATATTCQSAGLGIAWLIAALVCGVRFAIPGLPGVGWLAFIVLCCSVLPMTLFSAGVARVGAVTASTLATAEPVVGAVLAAVLLRQVPQPVAIAGAVVIVLACFITVAPRPASACARQPVPATRSRAVPGLAVG